MLETQSVETTIAGRTLKLETGAFAQQANAAVTVRYGDTMVLVTAVYSKEVKEGIDFLPLTVDYEERMYAAGKIPGGFIRREGRPSEAAILACRLTDRSIRPLISKKWHQETQVIATVLSADLENDADLLGLIGSSSALTNSAIPFEGPIGAVRVGYINDQYVLNPTMTELTKSKLDLTVSSSRTKIVMIEAGARILSEDIMLGAIEFAHKANQEIIDLQEKFQKMVGKEKAPLAVPTTVKADVLSSSKHKLAERMNSAIMLTKAEREAAFADITSDLVEELGETYTEDEIVAAFDAGVKAQLRSNILDKGIRAGGRKILEIRPINCQVGLLPRAHGSAMFTRGATQVLNVTTLGSMKQEQVLDGLTIEGTRRFMHHYNMPPYSTGEVKRSGNPGRREIGHGALAERALLPVVPVDESFPYTIRLVSEALSSSGSTSMASVCSGSMSLMDAGVPIKAAVAGIAMGLITDDTGRYAVLTDIEGLEDFFGDMDFKVAGTREGITAIQMDTKLTGLTMQIVNDTIRQAKDARFFIMDLMDKAISAPRSEVSKYAPRMYKIQIEAGKIGAVIGGGGKTIRSIIAETKTTIDITDDGTVTIGALDVESAQKAIRIIEGLTKDIEPGTVYTGKVTRVFDFGAMVEVLPGKEGLVHISELAEFRVAKVEDVVHVGDEIKVKVIGVDNLGRINLSRKALLDSSGAPAPQGEGGAPPPRQFPRSGPGQRMDDRRGGFPPRR